MFRRLTVIFALFLSTSAALAQETRSYTDSIGRTVKVPVEPLRIVSLHDHTLTLPLVEIGAAVVGSHGRQREDGSVYLRSVNTVLNVDFDNSDIAFVGAFNMIDFEAIAALEPDLIIGRAPWDEETLAQLAAAGTTVLVDSETDALTLYRTLADLVGKTEEFERRLAGYEALLEDAKVWLDDPSDLTYSKIQAYDGKLEVYANYGGLTRVLDDLGFQITTTAAGMRSRGVAWGEEISVELLPQQDADVMFDTYRIDQGTSDGPMAARERMADVLPSFCKVLTACTEGHYIFIPREHAAPVSFRTLEMNVHYIVSHLMGRPGITRPK